jgi:hypothetical protein
MGQQAKTHRDVEFAVDDAGGVERIFQTFNEAAGFALAVGAAHGEPINIDVLVSSEAGAAWWGGDAAVESYRADPDASVSDRVVVRVEHVGRVA